MSAEQLVITEASRIQPGPSTAAQASGPPTTPIIPGKPIEQLEIQEPDEDPESSEYPTGTKLWFAFVSLAVTSFVRNADITVVSVAVPSLTNDFHAINDIGWYNAAYMMVIGATGFFFGKAYTLFNTRRLYLFSLVVFWLGSTICTFATSSSVFIAGRAISGLGSSCEASGFITLLSILFPRNKRPRWIGNITFIGSAGLVCGPLLGGLLIQRFGWRACFGINIPLYGLCVALAFYAIPRNKLAKEDLPFKQKLRELDLTGSVVFAPALTCLLMALAWGGTTYGWNDGRIITLFVVSSVLLLLFSGLQWYLGENASIPPRILKQRSILAATWFSACCNGALAVTEYYIAIYFQGVRGLTAAQSALLGLPMIVGLMAASLIAGYGTSWIGYYNPFLLATSLIAPIASGVLTTISLTDQLAKAASLLGLLGFAIGIGLNAPMIAVSTILPSREVSIGAAILLFGGSMGSAVFSSVASALFQNRLEVEIAAFAGDRVNVTALEHAGLSDIRNLIGEDRLGAVLMGYDQAVVQTLYIPLALTLLTVVGSLMAEWRSVKKKTE